MAIHEETEAPVKMTKEGIRKPTKAQVIAGALGTFAAMHGTSVLASPEVSNENQPPTPIVRVTPDPLQEAREKEVADERAFTEGARKQRAADRAALEAVKSPPAQPVRPVIQPIPQIDIEMDPDKARRLGLMGLMGLVVAMEGFWLHWAKRKGILHNPFKRRQAAPVATPRPTTPSTHPVAVPPSVRGSVLITPDQYQQALGLVQITGRTSPAIIRGVLSVDQIKANIVFQELKSNGIINDDGSLRGP